MENNNSENKTDAPNNFVPKPKFTISLNDAIWTGYLLKFLAYLIFGVINWKLMIGFLLYNCARTLHLRCNIL